MVEFFFNPNARKNNFKIYETDLNLLCNWAATGAAWGKLVQKPGREF